MIACIEAAHLDGAGDMQIFFYIVLPLYRSVIVSVFLLVFIDCWNSLS